jgi:hypothetical protein
MSEKRLLTNVVVTFRTELLLQIQVVCPFLAYQVRADISRR